MRHILRALLAVFVFHGSVLATNLVDQDPDPSMRRSGIINRDAQEVPEEDREQPPSVFMRLARYIPGPATLIVAVPSFLTVGVNYLMRQQDHGVHENPALFIPLVAIPLVAWGAAELGAKVLNKKSEKPPRSIVFFNY